MKRIARHDVDGLVESAARDLRSRFEKSHSIIPRLEDVIAVADAHDLPLENGMDDPAAMTIYLAAFAPEEKAEISLGCDRIWVEFQQLDKSSDD